MDINMKNPAISILVPVYNVEPYLSRCIDSVLSQDFQDWEMILVDDGSPDKCGEICDKYAKKYPDKIKVIHKENGGLISARYCGVKEATGNFYIFLDSDDTLKPQAISTLYKHIKSGDYDIVRGMAVRIDINGVESPLEMYKISRGVISGKGKFSEALYKGEVAPYLWGSIYKASLFNDKVYQTTIKNKINVGEDWVTNMIISLNVEKCLFVSDIVYNYYNNSSSYMSSYVMSNEYLDKISLILNEYHIYNNEDIKKYRPIKESLDYIKSFFIPELKFSNDKYIYVKSVLKNHQNGEQIRRHINKRFLYFFNNKLVYRIYTEVYRSLFYILKLKFKTRKIIY